MRKLGILPALFFFLVSMFTYAQAATTPEIKKGEIVNQWIAEGQLNDECPVQEFKITTDDVSWFQLYSNITQNDTLDTVLALYNMDYSFIAYADDTGNSLNPSLFSRLLQNQEFRLKLGTYEAWNDVDHDFDPLTSSIDNYDYELAFVNIAKVVPTPLPAAAWLLGSGLVGLVSARRRFNK